MKTMTRRSVISSMLAASAAAMLFPGTAGAAEAQPAMRAALESLRAAMKSLEAATADKGGHRAKAMRLVRAAMAEVQRGMEYDERH